MNLLNNIKIHFFCNFPQYEKITPHRRIDYCQFSVSLLWFYFLCHKFPPIAVNQHIEREVNQYEKRYRGRELPGFINYKTFEDMVKEQIKKLEVPAVLKLKEVTGTSYYDAAMIASQIHI